LNFDHKLNITDVGSLLDTHLKCLRFQTPIYGLIGQFIMSERALLRYYWNIVEGGVKHHIPNPLFIARKIQFA